MISCRRESVEGERERRRRRVIMMMSEVLGKIKVR